MQPFRFPEDTAPIQAIDATCAAMNATYIDLAAIVRQMEAEREWIALHAEDKFRSGEWSAETTVAYMNAQVAQHHQTITSALTKLSK
jgi:hypothetical protein